MDRGGLGPVSLHGNRIYKDQKEIAKKKASHRLEKALIPLKMYLKGS
jgi:hypothetical protein